jgi:hypothetical protein
MLRDEQFAYAAIARAEQNTKPADREWVGHGEGCHPSPSHDAVGSMSRPIAYDRLKLIADGRTMELLGVLDAYLQVAG